MQQCSDKAIIMVMARMMLFYFSKGASEIAYAFGHWAACTVVFFGVEFLDTHGRESLMEFVVIRLGSITAEVRHYGGLDNRTN